MVSGASGCYVWPCNSDALSYSRSTVAKYNRSAYERGLQTDE